MFYRNRSKDICLFSSIARFAFYRYLRKSIFNVSLLLKRCNTLLNLSVRTRPEKSNANEIILLWSVPNFLYCYASAFARIKEVVRGFGFFYRHYRVNRRARLPGRLLPSQSTSTTFAPSSYMRLPVSNPIPENGGVSMFSMHFSFEKQLSDFAENFYPVQKYRAAEKSGELSHLPPR